MSHSSPSELPTSAPSRGRRGLLVTDEIEVGPKVDEDSVRETFDLFSRPARDNPQCLYVPVEHLEEALVAGLRFRAEVVASFITVRYVSLIELVLVSLLDDAAYDDDADGVDIDCCC